MPEPTDAPAMPVEPRSSLARQAVRSIQAAMTRHRGNVEAVERTCARYKEEFPTLFKLLTSREEYPPEVLEMMLRAVEQMERGRVSEHEASVAVGTVLVDRYVKPLVANLPPGASPA